MYIYRLNRPYYAVCPSQKYLCAQIHSEQINEREKRAEDIKSTANDSVGVSITMLQI